MRAGWGEPAARPYRESKGRQHKHAPPTRAVRRDAIAIRDAAMLYRRDLTQFKKPERNVGRSLSTSGLPLCAQVAALFMPRGASAKRVALRPAKLAIAVSAESDRNAASLAAAGFDSSVRRAAGGDRRLRGLDALRQQNHCVPRSVAHTVPGSTVKTGHGGGEQASYGAGLNW